ncbi:MAG: ribonucleoside-diphosphate reductase subunit alpha [Acidobacteriota bacterium]
MTPTRVVKRTGEVASFDAARIHRAISKAVEATGEALTDDHVARVVGDVVAEIDRRFDEFFPNVENIQDLVEKHLVLAGHYPVAKAYILYRADRQQAREAARERRVEDARLGKLTVRKRDGRVELLNVRKVERTLEHHGSLAETAVDADLLIQGVVRGVYDAIDTDALERAMVLAATALIERHPDYDRLAARLLLQRIYRAVFGRSLAGEDLDGAYRRAFVAGIGQGIEEQLLDPRLADYDLDLLAASLRPERDREFLYLGVQTLHDRYLVRSGKRLLETPQAFWMRVAMGLAVDEDHREERALEFYDLMSRLLYVPSTPTLFHSGTPRPQLSSCYLTTVSDDLAHIFKSLSDNAQLSKWSGGLGNDWTSIRATGAPIKSTHVESQGVIPFLKIANDVTMAINRSGKRRGATCAYLETWHYDFEDFLDLRRNTGDERRRTHDMNTAAWVPDLFMKRVADDATWTLFSPDEVPDLHDLYGRRFEERYLEYERFAERGEIRLSKRVEARALWRRMLTMLFETGHPWITFKDACNVRSPQDHCGVVHSSNLCTEITLNTSREETAVCNLGSVNLARHVADGGVDEEALTRTVATAIRMLDNVVDLNFYPTPEAKASNLRHRPVGLGVMGFQDVLFQLDLPFESEAALELADRIQESISYQAILASSRLAAERGAYPSCPGSKWDRGILPLDTLDLLAAERGVPIEVSRSSHLDWTAVREQLATHGMRNSNVMAVAPTATISNIAGCFPCIEPIFKNLYVKANISGEFTVVNRYLVEELEGLGLWSEDLLERLKAYDGDLSRLPEIPDTLREKYREAFAMDPLRLLRITAVRGKWIDQSQSHNVFLRGTSGKLLDEIYSTAWRLGLKTTYYLRTLAASQIEKSTVDAGRYGFTQKRAEAPEVAAAIAPTAPADNLCRIDDPECEACQ